MNEMTISNASTAVAERPLGLETRGVHAWFGSHHVLSDINLQFPERSVTGLIGPSGCGKTTLLRTLGGLEAPTSGAISIDEKDVTWVSPGARNIAMVFQDYALYPHMNVRDNISYPLKVKKFSKEEIERMKKDAEMNADADRIAKERAEKLNEADSMIFQTESQLKEFGEKLSDDKKKPIEEALEELVDLSEEDSEKEYTYSFQNDDFF